MPSLSCLAMPENPMSQAWCWPHEFGQPEMLIPTPDTESRPSAFSWSCTAAPRPREAVMARLQVSAPGHDTTSPDFSAKGRSRPCSLSTAQTWGSCSAVTSRKTTFWRIVSRASDTPVSRIIRAMARNCSGVRSPRYSDAHSANRSP